MSKTFDIWIGAYATQEQVGITRLLLDSDSGKLSKMVDFTGIDNPSFVTLDRSGRYLHAVSEVDVLNGQPGGEVITFELQEDETLLEEAMSHPTLGVHPCFVALDPQERWLAVSNYGGSSVVIYPIEQSGLPGPVHVRFRHTGSGPNQERQEAAHPHSAVFSADGQYLFVPDLGLDKIMVYAFDAQKQQWVGHDAVSLPAGSGPRHLKFHPSLNVAYVINELNCTVTHLSIEEPGRLVAQESISTLPASFTGFSTCAELVISPDGRTLYASNRGHDSIAIFQIDELTGQLSAAGHVSTRGKTPRNFNVTPDGRWLLVANQDSSSLVLFQVDAATGLPVFTGTELTIHKPACVVIR
ncbi:MAG: lactonase family protein [Candidatus Cohnella colombiensis]|uniref:Lactonase family protein n=1 Tax=Candidatus Cohnella colombiensis TaxID=3121368 RepID=A0AA95EWK0_9BACL|nr:MAG: lactonase family protein [Cohnella sp.]